MQERKEKMYICKEKLQDCAIDMVRRGWSCLASSVTVPKVSERSVLRAFSVWHIVP